jgi:uncharacterized protein YukE
MNKRPIQFVFLALLLVACAQPDRAGVEPARRPTHTPAATEPPGERVILHSASYTIIATDPARALSEMQQAVERAGGYVTSASSWTGDGSSSYASLSARVPPEALPALNEALVQIADQIQSQSAYIQDVTAEIAKLRERRQELTQAQDAVRSMLTGKSDRRGLDSYSILIELLDTELGYVEGQLDSYDEQSTLASFDVSINQPASVPALLE